MNIDVLNITGEKVKEIALPEDIFGVELNEALLHTAAKMYRSNRRQGTHATKTRAFVSGTGKKPFKQKGTGNARQGDSRSPLNPGGAITHGPQPRDYRQDMNKKAKKEALKVALSDKVRHGNLKVVDDFKSTTYSTKSVVAMNAALQANRTVLLLDERKDDLLYKSARNIHGTSVCMAGDVNAEHVLAHQTFVISENALVVLQKRLQGE